MIDDSEKLLKTVDIPADFADAWAAVILDLALKADIAGRDEMVDVGERETFNS